MSGYSEEKLKSMLLDAFIFTKQFLFENNLKYVACGGTVLGAVRHKGFIPWDDDIDIYMPRDDYNKLLKLKDKMASSDYEIISYNDEGYYMPYLKISHKKSTIWEAEQLPFVMGVFIDVFPLDEFNRSDEEITNLQHKMFNLFRWYTSSLSRYTRINLFSNIIHFNPRMVRTILLSKIRSIFSTTLLKKFKELEQGYVGQHGEKCVCVTQWRGRIFKTSWFNEVIEVPFESTTITIPKDYDSYLSLLYGNYMDPPPKEKRVTQHYHHFVDLNKRWTIDEIRKSQSN